MLSMTNAQTFEVPDVATGSVLSNPLFFIMIFASLVIAVAFVVIHTKYRNDPLVKFRVTIASVVLISCSGVAFLVTDAHRVDATMENLRTAVEKDYGVTVLDIFDTKDSMYYLSVDAGGQVYNCTQYVFDAKSTYSVYCSESVIRSGEKIDRTIALEKLLY